MFLSNPRKTFLLVIIFPLVLQACVSSPVNEIRPVSRVVGTGSGFPFSTLEPDIYQGFFVVGDGTSETQRFIARNGDKERFDIYRGAEKYVSQIKADQIYLLDHQKKIYASDNDDANSLELESKLGSLSEDFFKRKDYRDFEDLGVEGELRKYKIRYNATTKDTVFIYIDEASGMIVRQEFEVEIKGSVSPVKFMYEIRNLKFEADDSLFLISSDYRKVSWDEYKDARKAIR